MPPGDEYSVGGGKLKLKGSKVSDGRVDKKKKKNKDKAAKAKAQDEQQQQEESSSTTTLATADQKRQVMGDGDSPEKSTPASASAPEPEAEPEAEPDEGGSGGEVVVGKTEAEKRYEGAKRKRLQERLKREGVKTHKERVEELNKYLSRLSEHHDMPKIGPG